MSRLAVLAALVLVLMLPFLVRATSGTRGVGGGGTGGKDGLKLVVISPHVEQIREEFGRAFAWWHFRTKGRHVAIDWRTPGGTSDIMKQLESTLEAAAKNGQVDSSGKARPGSAGCDLFFGGGSFEHGKMKEEKKVVARDGKTIAYRMGQPARFEQQQLDEWFGANKIGVQNLYDPDQYWIGTALSGFGIVYNTDVLGRMSLSEPRSFGDLCDYRMFNMVALADGRQSGSVTTTYDSIMNKEGWERGWGTLREMCANARYFASSSTKPPIDVSQGEAAAGLAIDFYGRGQAQALLRPGQDPKTGRVGYVDPEGSVYIDADPASILNGAENFDLARTFIEFCMTEEAQALWQFPAIERQASPDAPTDSGGRKFGPDEYELRRMPARRVMFEKYQRFFVDQTNPFTLASDVPSRGWRSAIAPMMAAFGIDTSHELRKAWRVLNGARAAAKAARFPTGKLEEMERAFYAMPNHRFREGSLYALPEALTGVSKAGRRELRKNSIYTFRDLAAALPIARPKGNVKTEILAEWEAALATRGDLEPKTASVSAEFSERTYAAIDGDTNSWKDLDHGKRSLIGYAQFFREQYRRVIFLGEGHDLSGSAQ